MSFRKIAPIGHGRPSKHHGRHHGCDPAHKAHKPHGKGPGRRPGRRVIKGR